MLRIKERVKAFIRKPRVILSLIGLVLVLSGVGFYKVNQFFQKHEFVFESPVLVQTPVYLVDRAVASEVIVKVVGDNIPLSENEKYLCIKFGSECKTALEIQRRENGTGQCDRFHVNTNGSVDFGFMQVNSVHLKQGHTISQLVDCKANIDIAYEIYKASGWNAWSTYKLTK